MSAEVITKRLHVGGITPNISTAHLQDRFASFGKVHSVDEMENDALGQKRSFTYLTIDTTPAQLKKCLNIMSGSMWRGAQLKISEAKPLYSVRLEKERLALETDLEAKNKKRKRSERASNLVSGIGKEAQDMRMVTTDNYASRKFWNLTPTGHLIRPLAMRPCHALPPSLQDKVSSSSKPRPAPTRARRRVVNPYLWAPTHLGEATLDASSQGTIDKAGEWVWEDANDDEENDNQETVQIGTWRRIVDGESVETQEVRETRRAVETQSLEEESDEDMQDDPEEEGDNELFARRDQRDASPLFGVKESEMEDGSNASERSASRSASPLFGERAKSAQRQSSDRLSISRSPSPLFGPRPVAAEVAPRGGRSPSIVDEVISADEEIAEHQPSAEMSIQENVLSPSPVPMPAQIRPAAIPRTAIPEPLRREVQTERSRDLSLLDSILADAGDDLVERRPVFAGFAESDEDEDVPVSEGVLRLRGGAPDEDEDQDMSDSDSEPSSSSSSSSGSSSSESSDSQNESDGEEQPAKTSTQPTATLINGAQPLKGMFASTTQSSGGGFSLLASLDPDLEFDELDVPLAPSVRPAGQEELAPLEPLHPTSTVTGLFDPDPEIPLFFPTANTFAKEKTDTGKKGKDGYTEAMSQNEWRGFWKGEDQTDEMMKDVWNRDRGELTKEWKKRHREAKKHRRRRGGVDED